MSICALNVSKKNNLLVKRSETEELVKFRPAQLSAMQSSNPSAARIVGPGREELYYQVVAICKNKPTA